MWPDTWDVLGGRKRVGVVLGTKVPEMGQRGKKSCLNCGWRGHSVFHSLSSHSGDLRLSAVMEPSRRF